MPAASPTYHGQCHCGAVRFTATTNLGSMGDCNCSRCRRLGWVMQSVPASDFVLERGADQLTLYQFNTGTIAHQFCKTCGIESFARGTDGKGQQVVMINVHCLDDAPALDEGSVTHWDGANW
ncbi:MAG: GFA family protein [Devosia sp.]